LNKPIRIDNTHSLNFINSYNYKNINMIHGQILRGTQFGELIYKISNKKGVTNILEIGTWYGLGSTKCVIDGIMDSEDPKNFITIEMYESMYEIAKINLKEYLDRFQLLKGTILKPEDIYWFDFSDLDQNLYKKTWYDSDLSALHTSENVLNKIFDRIDFLILDGGEFTTYPEWLILKERTKIVALDDTNVFKCKKIREELLNDTSYRIIADVISERNGYSVFEKVI
jgi:hypothetical protein